MEPVQLREDDLDEGDLFVLVSETALGTSGSAPQGTVQPAPQEFGVAPEVEGISGTGVTMQPVLNPLLSSGDPPVSSVVAGESMVRRTGRRTAGQHSNVHHLPRSVGEGTVSSIVSSAVGALFRPWD